MERLLLGLLLAVLIAMPAFGGWNNERQVIMAQTEVATGAPVTVTIDEQISRIEEQLTRRQQVSFREFLSEATTKVEVIVTLLAVLELVKQDRARMRQEQLFGEIFIEREIAAPDEPAHAAGDDEPATSPAP